MKSVGKYISKINRRLNILLTHDLKKLNIGSGQYLFLINLYKQEGVNQKELGEKLNIDKANTARAIKKLEKIGYVESIIDAEDKRNKKIYLTKEGHTIIPFIKESLMRTRLIMLHGFTKTETNQLFYLLDKIENNVEKGIAEMRENVDE